MEGGFIVLNKKVIIISVTVAFMIIAVISTFFVVKYFMNKNKIDYVYEEYSSDNTQNRLDAENNNNEADSTDTIYINVIHDVYTTIKKLDLVYYRKPKRFDVIDVDGTTILNACELPENVHREIVELAVEMFITEAKYRLNMKQPASNNQ